MLMFTPNPASGLTRSCSKVGGAFDTKVTKKKEKIRNILRFRENISLRELTIQEALTCSLASSSEKNLPTLVEYSYLMLLTQTKSVN